MFSATSASTLTDSSSVSAYSTQHNTFSHYNLYNSISYQRYYLLPQSWPSSRFSVWLFSLLSFNLFFILQINTPGLLTAHNFKHMYKWKNDDISNYTQTSWGAPWRGCGKSKTVGITGVPIVTACFSFSSLRRGTIWDEGFPSTKNKKDLVSTHQLCIVINIEAHNYCGCGFFFIPLFGDPSRLLFFLDCSPCVKKIHVYK